jgi:chromosomal replication initiation ATPase DnaA
MNAESNRETPRERNLRQVDRIAARHNLTRQDILGPSRLIPAVNARRACVKYFIGKNMQPRKIGEIINRERTTVLYLAGLITKSKVAKKP